MTAPKFDPYAALGVDKDATPEKIKRAHRESVKRAHPDAGGDAKEFERVQRAYLVLIDSAKRSKFDSTGSVDDDKPEPNPDEPSLGIIANVIYAIIADEQVGFTEDLSQVVSMALQREIETVETKLRELSTPMRKAIKLKGRFKLKKAGENRIDHVIDWHIRQMESRIAKGREAIVQIRRAQEIIAEYDFERDPQQIMWGTMRSTTGNSFFNGAPRLCRRKTPNSTKPARSRKTPRTSASRPHRKRAAPERRRRKARTSPSACGASNW